MTSQNLPFEILLVPPLIARTQHNSMYLYWQNIVEAFDELGCGDSVTTHQWWNNSSRWAQRFHQNFTLRSLVKSKAREIERTSQRPVVVHVLDQHYGRAIPSGYPSVITCHDLAEYTYPKPTFKDRVSIWKASATVRADRIVAISTNTADDLTKYLGVAEHDICINPYGIDQLFQNVSDLNPPAVVEQLSVQNSAAKFALHVGTNVARKNIPTLLKGFALAKSKVNDLVLIKVGDSFFADGYGPLIESLGIRESIKEVGNVSQNELVSYYTGCDILLFPSSYEGFGRPVLEAMACGTPVICAKSSSLLEVSGDAGWLHETFSHEELARNIIEVLANNAARDAKIKAGIEHAKGFSWTIHARTLLDTYSAVLA